MFKYKNISKFNLLLEINGQLKHIKPDEEFTCFSFIDNKFLVEVTPKPIFKESKKFKVAKEDEA